MYIICGQRRLCLDCTDARAGLSLRWAHMSVYTFSHVAALIGVPKQPQCSHADTDGGVENDF